MKTNRNLDTKTVRHLDVPVTDFKLNAGTGEFTCYANVKNIVDYAGDRSVDGCFLETIARHKVAGTMPLMLWMHNPYELPVGTWLEWTEDEKGLRMRGRLSQSTKGRDIEILAKENAINKFSIGYRVVKGRWNDAEDSYDLLSVDVLEVSWVNFACNDQSDLQEIKSKLDNGELPTKRELQDILRKNGLSKRQAEKIVNHYSPDDDDEQETKSDALDDLAKYLTENGIKITL